MISLYKINNIRTGGGYFSVELRGLSTDEKPTEFNGTKIDNGSELIEINTGKIYLYDLENEEWNEV